MADGAQSERTFTLRADDTAEDATILERYAVQIIRGVHDGAGVDDVLDKIAEVMTSAASEIRSERAAFAVEFVAGAAEAGLSEPTETNRINK